MIRILIAAALAVAATGKPVFAEDGRTQRVSHADLRLDREADVRRLDRRLERAARAACGEAADYDVRGKNAARRCRDDTMASIAPQRDQLVNRAQAFAVASARR